MALRYSLFQNIDMTKQTFDNYYVPEHLIDTIVSDDDIDAWIYNDLLTVNELSEVFEETMGVCYIRYEPNNTSQPFPEIPFEGIITSHYVCVHW